MNDAIWLLVDSRDLGGIESHILQLSIGLKRRGRRPSVVFWANYGPHPLVPQLDAAGIPYRTLNGSWANFRHALRRERPAVLHTHGYKAGILGRIGARLCRIPVVSTFHAGEPGHGMVRLYGWLDRLTSGLGRRVAVSPAIARTLPAPVATIANFIEPPPPEDLSGPHDIVAFVGRLSFEKGPDLFCALAALLPDLRLEIFGDGPMRAELSAAPVVFHGRVSPMAPHWRRIGLLVMPSRHEGLPLAALEAMAQGAPVAAFAVGGLPDLITPGRDGFLAPAGDLDGLAAAIRQWAAMTAAERAAMAGAARDRIARDYAPEVGVAAILAVYRTAGAPI